ncbi:hypothetical protein ACQYZ7_10085 [Tenacibaculum sp. SDUM215027]
MEKIKGRLLVIFLGLFIYGCEGQINKKELLKNYKITNKQYYLTYQYFTPFEITVNDLIVLKNIEGNFMGAENLNSYLLKNERQKIRINIRGSDWQKGNKISFKDLNSIKLGIIESTSQKDTLIKKFDIESFENEIPIIEQEWEFEAELPAYCDNLENSEDLGKWDEKTLEEAVVNRFTELRNLLNNGNGNQVYTEVKKATEAIFTAEYMDNSEQQEFSTNITDFFTSHKGTMLPIENYHLRLMGNGKAVALEYATGKLQGLGILSSEDIKENTQTKRF